MPEWMQKVTAAFDGESKCPPELETKWRAPRRVYFPTFIAGVGGPLNGWSFKIDARSVLPILHGRTEKYCTASGPNGECFVADLVDEELIFRDQSVRGVAHLRFSRLAVQVFLESTEFGRAIGDLLVSEILRTPSDQELMRFVEVWKDAELEEGFVQSTRFSSHMASHPLLHR
mgnify:CR=1 FL=1